MSQLKMIFNAAENPLPELILPAGFRVRCIDLADARLYSALRVSVGFPAWDSQQLLAYRNKALPEGHLLVEEIASGRFAASAGAETTDFSALPQLGVIGWVMTHPEFQGLHLGRSVSVAAMHRLYEAGYRAFSLLTDDFRVPALITYLGLGWQPWLCEDDMEGRWRCIAEKLGRSFDELAALPAQLVFPARTAGK